MVITYVASSAVSRNISLCFSTLSLSLQGSTGKAGAPGEIGPQGLPVSMTFNPKLSGLTLYAPD